MAVSVLHDGYPICGQVRALVFDGDLPFANDPKALLAFIDSGEAERVAVSASTWTNMVTNAGRAQRAKLITATESTGMNAIGLTTSATTPSLGLTSLTNEIKRNMVSVKEVTATYTERYISYFTTSDFASTGVQGAGGFDMVSTGGNLHVAAVIALSKSNVQGAILEWQVTLSS